MTVLQAAFFESSILISAICIFITYLVTLAVFRLYFSPLAKFPGPWFAAVSFWPEFWYDVVERGRYTWKIMEMHKQYGPIIRINPYELHINDLEYYDEVYVSSSQRRTNKYPWSIKGFGPMTSAFATESHDLHRVRRSAIAPFFSTASVAQLEPSVQANIDKLVSRLEALKDTGKVVDVANMFISLTADIISNYAFALPFGFLDDPDFAPHWRETMLNLSETSHLYKQFGFLEPMFRSIPPNIVLKISPWLGSIFSIGDKVRTKLLVVNDEVQAGRKPQGQRTIFYGLLTSDQLHPNDKTIDRLGNEGISMVGAGSNTVAHTLDGICFHLIDNPSILSKVHEELASVIHPSADTPPKFSQLQGLPYLTAVITEGLRWGHGVTHRLQRVSPDVALQYKSFAIPAGTPVGMTSIMMHDNPDIFPDPRAFIPERWLGEDAIHLRKYLVAFSKGSRQCLGINLAYCELYLTVAALFTPGRFRFELFDTDVTDVESYHDFFNAFPRLDSKGIRILVK